METWLEWLQNEWVWIFVNIVLPIGLPVFGMFLMRVSMQKPLDPAERKIALRTRRYVLLFKDGQLGWVALVMCFAAVSDFAEGLVKGHKAAPAWTIAFLLGVALITLPAGVFATNGAVDAVKVVEAKSARNWFGYYAVAFWSTIVTIGAAALLAAAHFWSTAQ
ncbi:hypothetical protein [Luteibacter sp. CQ10]|uniref:hypothetical protein n=1 Tax=Luteibacter sp. CQ10 TaxID=2805821 RepID=UPI0034A17749